LHLLFSVVLERSHPFRFQASAVSMFPLIRDGDTITLAPLAQRQPRLGNVLAFISPANNKLLVHRVVGVRKSQLALKADNGNRPYGWVNPQDILGRVVQADHQGQPYRIGLGPKRLLIAKSSGVISHKPLKICILLIEISAQWITLACKVG
jgi:hypothetical protein